MFCPAQRLEFFRGDRTERAPCLCYYTPLLLLVLPHPLCVHVQARLFVVWGTGGPAPRSGRKFWLLGPPQAPEKMRRQCCTSGKCWGRLFVFRAELF